MQKLSCYMYIHEIKVNKITLASYPGLPRPLSLAVKSGKAWEILKVGVSEVKDRLPLLISIVKVREGVSGQYGVSGHYIFQIIPTFVANWSLQLTSTTINLCSFPDLIACLYFVLNGYPYRVTRSQISWERA